MNGQPSLWDKTGGLVSDKHPQTSHTAARRVRSGSQKAQILIELHSFWPDQTRGLTGFALAELVVNGAGRPVSPNQVCTRLLELRDEGLVDYVRPFAGGPIVEATTTPGNTGQVHRLTESGYRATILLFADSRVNRVD